MTSSVVYNAVKSRLVDQLGGTYPVRDWEEIEMSLQREINPWVALEDGGSDPELGSIGTPQSNWTTDTGYIDIHIFVPSTGGLDPARTIADAVRTALQYVYYAAPSGQQLRTKTVSAPSTGSVHDGLWHSMFVTVETSHRYAVATAAE